MDNFVLIAIAILVGYTLQKFKIFAKETPLILNQFIIYVSLPAVILMQVPKLTFSFDILIPTIVAWLVMGISALIVIFISKLLNWNNEVTGSLMLVAILTNSSIMGIPIINAYLGESALPYVLIYDQLGTFIALATYGTFVTAYYSSKSNINSKVIVQKVLTFPPFLSLIFALCFLGVEFNPLITNVLSNFAATLVPVALVAVGLQLQFKVPKDEIQPLSIALIIKLILAPIIAYIICYAFGWLNTAGITSIFEAAMAPMITAGAIASIAGLAPRLSTAIVGYGIIFSFLTTAILFKLIG
ncbi:MAG: AEC family transporter [Aliarcobacter sp.]|nr:AEC family transporter [Aliarcobacter sp.]